MEGTSMERLLPLSSYCFPSFYIPLCDCLFDRALHFLLGLEDYSVHVCVNADIISWVPSTHTCICTPNFVLGFFRVTDWAFRVIVDLYISRHRNVHVYEHTYSATSEQGIYYTVLGNSRPMTLTQGQSIRLTNIVLVINTNENQSPR